MNKKRKFVLVGAVVAAFLIAVGVFCVINHLREQKRLQRFESDMTAHSQLFVEQAERINQLDAADIDGLEREALRFGKNVEAVAEDGAQFVQPKLDKHPQSREMLERTVEQIRMMNAEAQAEHDRRQQDASTVPAKAGP